MIEIIPAISVYGNKVARINQCDPNDISFYDEAPLDMALKFEDHGIKRVHVIDLEGSRKGKLENTFVIENLKGYTDLTIDFGGGLNEDDDVRFAFETGASTIHAASVAVKSPDTFSSWIISYGRNKIILSADARNGKIATGAWAKYTEIDLMDHIQYFYDQSVMYVKVTDIGRDDQLQGPSFDLYKKILERFPGIKLMASGGVRSIADIEALQNIGCYGVIFAKAYYEGLIRLEDIKSFLGR